MNCPFKFNKLLLSKVAVGISVGSGYKRQGQHFCHSFCESTNVNKTKYSEYFLSMGIPTNIIIYCLSKVKTVGVDAFLVKIIPFS